MTALGGVGRALSVPDFRVYWYGMSIGTMGTWIYFVALQWLTWELTHSTAWLGLIMFVGVLPQVLFGPVTGAIIDKIGSHFVCRLISLFAGVWAGGFAVLLFADLASIEALVAFTLINGLAMAFHGPSHMALVAHLVPRQELSTAVALQSATVQLARFVGPALGGVLLVTAGPAWAFVVNAASYFIFFVAILFTEYRDRPSQGPMREGLRRDVLEGLSYAWSSFPVRTVLLAAAGVALLLRPFQELMAGIADQIFQHGADGLAILLSAAGVGALISALWLARRGRTTGLTRLFMLNTVLGGAALFAFVTVGSYEAAIGLAAVAGFSTNAASICAQILLQNAVTHEMRARVMSLLVMTFRAIPATGAFVMGSIAETAGLAWPIAAAAALSLFVALAVRLLIARKGLAEAAEG